MLSVYETGIRDSGTFQTKGVMGVTEGLLDETDGSAKEDVGILKKSERFEEMLLVNMLILRY